MSIMWNPCEVGIMADLVKEWINPRRMRWGLYGSFLQITGAFICVFLIHNELIPWSIDINVLLVIGSAMGLLSVKNIRMRYGTLEAMKSQELIKCPKCDKSYMVASKHQCPECQATLSDNEID